MIGRSCRGKRSVSENAHRCKTSSQETCTMLDWLDSSMAEEEQVTAAALSPKRDDDELDDEDVDDDLEDDEEDDLDDDEDEDDDDDEDDEDLDEDEEDFEELDDDLVDLDDEFDADDEDRPRPGHPRREE